MIDERLKHVAIIMDGNGRWAKERGMIRSLGHKAGFDSLEHIANHAFDMGIKYLTVYAFSTDNFKRSKEEVDYLMNLFVEKFETKYESLVKKGVKVVFSGSRIGLREDVVNAMDTMINRSKDNTKATLNICLNYGAQEEIIRAAERYHEDLVNGKVKIGDINRDNFYRYLDQELPPIDIMIRTGGDKRLSNFMLYQLTYAELYFVDTYFPAFTPEMFDDVINNFYGRERRFGGINETKTKN